MFLIQMKGKKQMYKFTRKLPYDTCKICGEKIDKKWSHGGIGGTCRQCADTREKLDLVNIGIVRNIKPIRHKAAGDTFEFEAKIDDIWYKCARPCGDWCMILNVYKDPTNDLFSVPVGFWEVQRLYRKHYENELPSKTAIRIYSEGEGMISIHRQKIDSDGKVWKSEMITTEKADEVTFSSGNTITGMTI